MSGSRGLGGTMQIHAPPTQGSVFPSAPFLGRPIPSYSRLTSSAILPGRMFLFPRSSSRSPGLMLVGSGDPDPIPQSEGCGPWTGHP